MANRKGDTMTQKNPITSILLPLADEFEKFTRELPPDFSDRKSLYFERLYANFKVDIIRVWLSKAGADSLAEQVDRFLRNFLTRLRRFEISLNNTGVCSTDSFEALQRESPSDYWAIRNEYDDIIDLAAEIVKFLRNLSFVYRDKMESIGLKDQQLTILCDLSVMPNVYRNLDDIHGTTAENTEASRDTTYRYLESLVKLGFTEKSSPRGGYKITDKGLDFLRLIDFL